MKRLIQQQQRQLFEIQFQVQQTINSNTVGIMEVNDNINKLHEYRDDKCERKYNQNQVSRSDMGLLFDGNVNDSDNDMCRSLNYGKLHAPSTVQVENKTIKLDVQINDDTGIYIPSSTKDKEAEQRNSIDRIKSNHIIETLELKSNNAGLESTIHDLKTKIIRLNAKLREQNWQLNMEKLKNEMHCFDIKCLQQLNSKQEKVNEVNVNNTSLKLDSKNVFDHNSEKVVRHDKDVLNDDADIRPSIQLKKHVKNGTKFEQKLGSMTCVAPSFSSDIENVNNRNSAEYSATNMLMIEPLHSLQPTTALETAQLEAAQLETAQLNGKPSNIKDDNKMMPFNRKKRGRKKNIYKWVVKNKLKNLHFKQFGTTTGDVILSGICSGSESGSTFNSNIDNSSNSSNADSVDSDDTETRGSNRYCVANYDFKLNITPTEANHCVNKPVVTAPVPPYDPESQQMGRFGKHDCVYDELDPLDPSDDVIIHFNSSVVIKSMHDSGQ